MVFSSFEMLEIFNFYEMSPRSATIPRPSHRSTTAATFLAAGCGGALPCTRLNSHEDRGRRKGEKIEHTKRGGGKRERKKSKCGEPGADHERTHKKEVFVCIIHAGNGSRILEK